MNQVRAAFEHPAWYLRTSLFNRWLRADIVREFTDGRPLARILDVGSGDGSISLPLLRRDNHLTLVDFSKAMLAEAEREIPPELRSNVTLINEDVMTAPVAGPYDLVLCIGLLAHVVSAEAALARLTSLLSPGGFLICQITDSQHTLTQISQFCRKLRSDSDQAQSTSPISAKALIEMCGVQGLGLVDYFRYSSPLPGMRYVFSDKALYRYVRFLHGYYPRNRNSGLGNELMCLFQREARHKK